MPVLTNIAGLFSSAFRAPADTDLSSLWSCNGYRAGQVSRAGLGFLDLARVQSGPASGPKHTGVERCLHPSRLPAAKALSWS